MIFFEKKNTKSNRRHNIIYLVFFFPGFLYCVSSVSKMDDRKARGLQEI